MIAAVHLQQRGPLFSGRAFYRHNHHRLDYLLHAFYKREGIDYRHKKAGVVQTTASGADKYWELSQCLTQGLACPLDKGVVNNLKFLSGSS